MSRNRKHQTAAARFGPALRAFCLCLFLGSSGVGYVWQKQQINILGERLRQRESRYESVKRQSERLSRALASLLSPGELEARIHQMDLGLIAPQPDQIVRLQDLPAQSEVTTNNEPRLYAEHRGMSWPNP